jgi:hypothetical protein
MAQLERLPRTATSGWIAGRPDPRDFTLSRKQRTPLGLRVLQALDRRAKTLGDVGKYTLDLLAFGPVRNQGSLNACCAFAGVSLMEYRVRRDRGPSNPDCSVGFLYKVTRDLMKTDDAKDGGRVFDGNAPVHSRTTMKAMTMIGVAPEKVFPTSEQDLDSEPQALTYALAGNFRATAYWRVDTNGTAGAKLLTEVKRMIRGDYPLMFTVRFLVQTSLFDFAKKTAKLRQLPVPPVNRIRAYKTYETVGSILAPGKNSGLVSASAGAAPVQTQTRAQATMAEVQRALGLTPGGSGRTSRSRRARGAATPNDQLVGHALVACGFDDARGCLLVRNSWSDEWGRAAGRPGYGWLPYEYVTEGLTEDWWFISDVSFVDPTIFGAMPAAPAA